MARAKKKDYCERKKEKENLLFHSTFSIFCWFLIFYVLPLRVQLKLTFSLNQQIHHVLTSLEKTNSKLWWKLVIIITEKDDLNRVAFLNSPSKLKRTSSNNKECSKWDQFALQFVAKKIGYKIGIASIFLESTATYITHTHTHIHSHTFSLSHTHTHTHTYIHTHFLSVSHTHSHTFYFSLSSSFCGKCK